MMAMIKTKRLNLNRFYAIKLLLVLSSRSKTHHSLLAQDVLRVASSIAMMMILALLGRCMLVPKLNDVSDTLKNTFNILTKNISEKVNVGNFYMVKKFYPDGPSADIVSLVDDDDGIDKAVKINKCPVLETALIKIHMNEPAPHKQTPYYKPLEEGDKVFVVFNNVDLDEFDGSKIKKSSERRHSINDAVIIGRYKSKKLSW